jgi:uncharacterized protein (TIGR02145 family)
MFLKNKPALSLRGSVTTAAITCLLLLIACGDDTTEVISGQNYIEIVAEESDLPECSEDNEGEQVLVKGENIARTCVDGEWTAAFTPGRDTVYLKNKDISCYTKELADKQGVKIICDGDSVGVLLNGSAGDKGDKGDKGADGVGCSLKQLDSVTAHLVCGGDTMTVYLGLPADTAKTVPTDEIDSEKIPVSLDSLVGYAQYGLFKLNSVVRLYGLDDSRAQKLSGTVYTSEITDTLGYYKFRGFDLPSQYAILEVEGRAADIYRFRYPDTLVRMRALVDLSERTTANVNVLTDLEFERVNYLVTHEGLSVKQAKKQAQSEIFAQFYIDAEGFEASEQLSYFGETEADAALFAVSFMLASVDGDDRYCKRQLFADALKTTGMLGENNAEEIKSKMANNIMRYSDWVYTRYRVEKLGKGKKVGNFEKYVETVIENAFAVEPCGEGHESELRILDKDGTFYHEYESHCHGGFLTRESKNTFTNPEIDYGWMVDLHDRHAYRTVKIGEQTWMAENLSISSLLVRSSEYIYESCPQSVCDVYGFRYSWDAVMDVNGFYSANGIGCYGGTTCRAVYPVQGICPEGWHVPDTTEFRTLIDAVGGAQNAGRVLKSTSGWVDEEGEGENGIDSVGFSMLPTTGKLWSATYCNENCSGSYTYYMSVDSQSSSAVISAGDKSSGYHIRCLKD